MSKTITINDRYEYLFTSKPINNPDGTQSVGVVKDKEQKRIVLMLDVLEGLLKNHKSTVVLAGELHSDKDNNSCARVLIDPQIFKEEFLMSDLGMVSLMHELGHYLNGHLLTIDENYSERRTSAIKEGKVIEEELKADEFAIEQCGIDAFKKFIGLMEFRAEYFRSGDNYTNAMKEFELRKAHGVEFYQKKEKEKNSCESPFDEVINEKGEKVLRANHSGHITYSLPNRLLISIPFFPGMEIDQNLGSKLRSHWCKEKNLPDIDTMDPCPNCGHNSYYYEMNRDGKYQLKCGYCECTKDVEKIK